MDVETIQTYCLSLDGTEQEIKWLDNLCFMIEKKIFVLVSLENGSFTIKCDPEDFEELTARDGVKQAAHFAKYQWITISHPDVFSFAELQACISKSRQLVLAKLPKKIQVKYA